MSLRAYLFGQRSPSLIPLGYAVIALVAGFVVPKCESLYSPTLLSPMSVASAVSIYSSIASGMIALTGIVYSLTFVMLQFSATAYSPRLVLWIGRDSVVANALGVFVATFLYAVAALAGVDRNHSGTVPYISVYIVVGLLLVSVAMFVALIHRIGVLQVNRMLIFIGTQGRKVIQTLYKPLGTPGLLSCASVDHHLAVTQIMVHRGSPRTIQVIDVKRLLEMSARA